MNYLRDEWSEKSVTEFLQKLTSCIDAIKVNPEMFAVSEFDRKLRKAVITKQTSILYEVVGDTIFVLNVIDNRQRPTT